MICAYEPCTNEVPPQLRKAGAPKRYCSDNCRKRACDERHRARCIDCNKPLAPRSGWPAEHPNDRCRACHREREAKAHRARLEDVAAMFNEGMSMAEIASELGYGPGVMPKEVTLARQAGLIGYRNRGWEDRAA